MPIKLQNSQYPLLTEVSQNLLKVSRLASKTPFALLLSSSSKLEMIIRALETYA